MSKPYVCGKKALENKLSSHGMDSFNLVSHGRNNNVITAGIVDTRENFRTTNVNRTLARTTIPEKFDDQIRSCRKAYYSCSIVRNVMDLMTDFVLDGFDIDHEDKEVQKFYQNWVNNFNVYNALQEFVRHFLVECNVISRRVTAKLTKPVERMIFASVDIKLYTADFREKVSKNEIPVKYIFIDPATVSWKGGDLSMYSDTRQLVAEIDFAKLSQSKEHKKFIDTIKNTFPEDIRKAIEAGKSNTYDLDMDKIQVFHSKKDSWDQWATPFLVSVIPDIYFKQKLKQADLSVLDGVINVLRIWKLGDHTKEIFPTSEVAERLQSILNHNEGNGVMDLIWDSMLQVQELYPPVDKMLGSEKYDHADKDILVGLGIPEVLIGGKGANFSNAFIQLKTIAKRLEAARRACQTWLMNEISLINEAMGFESDPHISFNSSSFSDESTMRQFLLGLWDRGVLASESVLEMVGKNYDIQIAKRSDEQKKADEKGVELVSPIQSNDKLGSDVDPTSGGRPNGEKDKSKRKERKAKPISSIRKSVKEVINIVAEDMGVKRFNSLSVANKTKFADSVVAEVNKLIVDFVGMENKKINTFEMTKEDDYKSLIDKVSKQIVD